MILSPTGVQMANLVYVTGGNKVQKDIALKTVHWCLKKFLPRHRTLDIDIQIKSLKGAAYGWCMQEDDREYVIEIERKLSMFEFVGTLCHEMVHLKQYVRKELRETNGNTMWKTKVYNNVNYADAPWEKEAYRLENKLAHDCFEEAL
jgi:hypothetical protein